MTTQQISLFDQLPKVSWEEREDGVMDYKTPDGEWGWRSSALGKVDWENEDRRNVFIAYDALMRCSDFFFPTHEIGGRSRDPDIELFQKDFMDNHRARILVASGSKEDCLQMIVELRAFADAHPQYFEAYIEREERMRDPEGFEIHQIYTSESKG